ncbi:Retrovirus-related Pol polyprotein from transposon 412 [Includes: Protease [Durusdinium trenchii]|uniref:Retrovirus-related Pol polyprotein from transposon 412 n=1 Tax=Durusdinium trenchii TaxID=1381693 RepID=A0ABP0IHR4_9DINO
MSKEVADQPEGVTLGECIADGRAPVPEEMSFFKWPAWRKVEGKRPTRRRDGRGTTTVEEVALWRATMADLYGDDRAEGAAEVEELLKQLKALYRPQDEMSEYLTRITRLVLALKTLGHEGQLEGRAGPGGLYERVGDRWDVRGMVRYLREKFTTAAVGTEMPAENITEHVSAIGELIMQLGGKESTQSGKLFSTPSQDEDRPAGGTPPRPISLGDMSRERMGPKDLGGDSPLRAKVATLEMELEALRHGSEASDGHKDLAAALEAQTRALEAALTGKSQQTSLTSVKTDVNWPTLTDDRSEARDVVQFYEEFEDCCSLANNCKGMSYREQLIALRGRCKGSRLKTYTNIYRSAWKSGEILENLEKVYNRIKEKHLVFAESKEEKEVRIDNEHALLNKGRMSAHQFEPLFEASVSELESIGLGKTPRELYLSYLRKMPMHLQKEIRGDKRLWKGETLLRSPQTWEEAHRVVLEFEQREATHRATANAVYSYGDEVGGAAMNNPFAAFSVVIGGVVGSAGAVSRFESGAATQPPQVLSLEQPSNPADGKSRFTSLDDLPKDWFHLAENEPGGYQYKTVVRVLDKKVETMLDGCAGSNHLTEELVVGMLNRAAELNIAPNDKRFPVVRFEKWTYPEYVHGIASGAPVPLKGAVVIRVRFLEGEQPERTKDGPEILVRCKVAARGTSDWHGLILGGRALDCEAKSGLGFRPGPDAHILDTLGIKIPRCEDLSRQRKDRAYAFHSVLSSLDEPEGFETGGDQRQLLRFAGEEPVVLAPGDGALVPVTRDFAQVIDGSLCEGVLPIEGPVEAVPGIWDSGAVSGMVLVTAQDEEVTLEAGRPVAEVRPGLAEVTVCECGMMDSHLTSPSEGKVCQECGVGIASSPSACQLCGATERAVVRDLQGCRTCARTLGARTRRAGYGLLSTLAAASVLLGTMTSPREVSPETCKFLDGVPTGGWRECHGGHCYVGKWPFEDALTGVNESEYPFRTLVVRQGSQWALWETVDLRRWSFSDCADLAGDQVGVFCTKAGPRWAGWLDGSATSGLGTSRGLHERRETGKNPCLHIVETVDMEKMGEETPTDYYYSRLRADLGERYKKADPHLLDHLVSLEGFLDKSIIFGFSFGISKAEICVTKGKLLGHFIGRSGSSPDPERCQAVKDFPPLTEKVQIQQFLGCANWLRGYMTSEYGHAAKVLGAWQKPGAVFPEKGLGTSDTDGCKAFRAIKRMMRECIALAVFDEASAADGSCPLEQVADASGIAVGGTVLQMSRDLSRMKVLMTHSRSLTEAQQNWPPLIQEAFAQLEVKRASRKMFGTIKSICWTDRANLTRSQTSDIGVDAKLVRWVAEILADGSEIRSLSGRSAKLGDGFSRNPKDRDALLQARTKDLAGIAGQLKGFNLEEYLGAGTEDEEGAIPWAVGEDAVPNRIAVAEDCGAEVIEARVLVVMDYQRHKEGNAVLADAGRLFEHALPGIKVQLRACYGPFEDDEGCCSHFDGAAGRLSGGKKIKRLRVDLLTSCAKVLREIGSFLPDLVVGFGQGGVISALLRWPLVTEVTLQARNLQVKETVKVGAGWGRIKGVWAVDPRIWRNQVGQEDVGLACPELGKEFPVEPLRGFGVATKKGRPDETARMLEALRLTRVERVDSVGLRSALSEPPREMWEHEGLCSCGKRTYLFSRCPTCIAREAEEDFARAVESSVEAKEEEENDDLRLEVAGMLAAVEKPSGGLFIPEELVRKWGSGGLIDRLRSSAAVQSVETQFGMLAARLWKKTQGFRNLGKPCQDFPYRTVWIVMHDGEVVQGHQCCKEETATKVTMEWALEQVHWHNHTSLITEVCERVWENRSAENLPPSFRRLLRLLGPCAGIEGWDDGKGSESKIWVLTDWGSPGRQEAREGAGVAEFRVSGSLRTSWYDAQRRDDTLAGHFRKPEYPFRVSGDGVLEREVKLKTGQTVQVPVVPNGVAAANGLTWRRACYNAVHGGVLGAHRSAQVTLKLMERAVWWPAMEEDIKRWAASCLACLKGRGRPTKVETKAVKCTASTCWEEVSVDCEGPNREDRAGYRYSLTYLCCLSHAILLEPLRSLTHSEVRRAFTRCVLRSRTIPSLVRSDRGVEFKNSLMQELHALLGSQQRFSTALRPCELGTNERVHQEVQKVLGAILHELGSTDCWSDWLIVAEYVLDNTPGPHGYTPRDLERSWSLALPLERDVLKDAMSFEPVSEWAARQFAEFREISAIVSKHWDAASEARAKLANRFRRSVDLKVGDRVVWRSPTARPEGAGRMPWRPGLNGPWEIVEVRGHRLLLEPVVPPVPFSASDPRKRIEAHAEDCILVPADSDPPESRDPVVFEDDREGQAPSLGQQVVGDTTQVEFSVQRRGRQFVLRLGERIAYKRSAGQKVCSLGQVTQVDVAQGQVGVHRYLPEVGGLRVKWRLAYLNEEGELGLAGARPAQEPVKIKEIICKVDISKDGVLAAASARKLDKGGYALEERVARVERAGPVSAAELCRELLTELGAGSVVDGSPSVWRTEEGRKVAKWVQTNGRPKVRFWEVFAGEAGLSSAARREGFQTAPPLDRLYPGCGRSWDLSSAVDQELFWALFDLFEPAAIHLGLPCEPYSISGKRSPQPSDELLREFAIRVLLTQEERERAGSLENPVSSLLWSMQDWIEAFGALSGPRKPWQYARTDACQYGMESRSLSDDSLGQPIEKGQVWLADFPLSSFTLRCKQPDALGKIEHNHRHVRGSVKVETEQGLRWVGCGILSGAYGPLCCESYMRCLKATLESGPGSSTPAGAGVVSTSAPRPLDVPVMATRGDISEVVTTEKLGQEARDALEKEIVALSERMNQVWKDRADKKAWDEVRADLAVYRLSGQKVEEDPRRTAKYRQEVVDGLGFGSDAKDKRPEMNEDDLAACREVLSRKATDVLASAAGSIWYSFVDAVTGFNQIANTRRAMEILAIVARSGKFLPVCLTFGPVNGPDDFCFVVDRAYGPGRGRKMKYTKEWIAYVDDLTVRTGRVVDGRFLTDEEADAEIKEACRKAPVEGRGAELGRMGGKGKRKGSKSKDRKNQRRTYAEDLHEMGYCLTRACRHGAFGHCGSAMKGGWIRLSQSSQLFGVPESWLIQAVEADAENVKPRLQLSEDRTRVRAFCGHSADLGIADAGAVYEEAEVSSLRELRLSPFSDMWHGTDLEKVSAICNFGLLAGGGSQTARLTVHWTVGRKPSRGNPVVGFRADSTAVIHTTIQALWDSEVTVWHGPEGVLLTSDAGPEALRNVFVFNEETGEYDKQVAAYSNERKEIELLPDPSSGPVQDADDQGVRDTDLTSESSFEVEVIGAPTRPSEVKREEPSPERATPRFATLDSGVPGPGTAVAEAQEEVKEAPERERSPAPKRRARARIPKGYEGEPPNFWWVHLPKELWQKDGCCRLCTSRSGIKGKCPVDDDHLVSDRHIDEMFKLEARYERERAAAAAAEAQEREEAALEERGAAPGEGASAEGRVVADDIVTTGWRFSKICRSVSIEGRKEKEGSKLAGVASRFEGDAAASSSNAPRLEELVEEAPAGGARLARAWSRKVSLGGVRAVEQALANATAAEIRHGFQTSSQAATLAEHSQGGTAADAARGERLEGLMKAGAAAYAANQLLRSRLGSEPVPEGSKPQYDYGSSLSELRPEGRELRRVAVAVAGASDAPAGATGLDARHTAALEAREAEGTGKSLRQLMREAKGPQNIAGPLQALVKPPCGWIAQESAEKREFKESREWAPVKESLRAAYEAKRKRKAEKKEEHRTLLGKALSFAKWECSRLAAVLKLSMRSVVRLVQQKERRTPRTIRSWLNKKSRNRLQHALNGNGPGWMKVLAFLAAVPLVWRTEQGAEEVVDALTSYAQRTIAEVEEVSVEIVQVTGRIVVSAVLATGMGILWWLGNLVRNKLVKSSHGNSLPARLLELKPSKNSKSAGGSTWEVTGGRGVHRVWIGEDGQGACACRAYLASGVCGHIDSAVGEARRLKVYPEKEVRFAKGSAAEKGAASLLALGAENATREKRVCFEGVAKKARELWLKPSSPPGSQGSESGCFGGVSKMTRQTELKSDDRVAKEATAGLNVQLGLENAPAAQNLEIEYVRNKEAQVRAVELLQQYPKASVRVTAYSFDQPDMVEVIKGHQGFVRILVDAGMTHESRTKMQLQSLMMLRNAGHRIRVCRGRSLSKAYAEDSRSTTAGSGLKGIQHSKTCFVENGKVGHLVVGSCNWTTSSKANRESGVVITADVDHRVFQAFKEHFEEDWEESQVFDEADFQSSQGQRPKAGRKQSSASAD